MFKALKKFKIKIPGVGVEVTAKKIAEWAVMSLMVGLTIYGIKKIPYVGTFYATVRNKVGGFFAWQQA